MTLRVFMLGRRKPGVSLEKFRQHWDKVHVPIIKDVGGADFPLSHTRHFVTQIYPDPQGSESMPYDAVGELTFQDQAHLDRFLAKIKTPEGAARIAADEQYFLDKPSYRSFVVVESDTETNE